MRWPPGCRGCKCCHSSERLYQKVNQVRDDETLSGAHVVFSAAFEEIRGKGSRLLEKEPECIQHASIQMKQTLRNQLEGMSNGIVVFVESPLATTGAVTRGQRLAA